MHVRRIASTVSKFQDSIANQTAKYGWVVPPSRVGTGWSTNNSLRVVNTVDRSFHAVLIDS